MLDDESDPELVEMAKIDYEKIKVEIDELTAELEDQLIKLAL